MTTLQTPNADLTADFETKSCPRCGGCGRYSFNPMTLDRCFKCGGAGVVFTARGRAAYDFWRNLRMTKAQDLQVGDKIWDAGISKGQWRTVTGIEVSGSEVEVQTQRMTFRGFGEFVRMSRTDEESQAKKAQALAYQQTLTKAGKPRK